MPDVDYRDPSNPTKTYKAYYDRGYSKTEESASSMNISSNMITYTSQGARHNRELILRGRFGGSDSDVVDGYVIPNPNYNYGKRVVSVTYRKNS